MRFDPLQKLDAAHIRHHEIRNDQVRLYHTQLFKRFSDLHDRMNLITAFFQSAGEKTQYIGFVVNNKETGR